MCARPLFLSQITTNLLVIPTSRPWGSKLWACTAPTTSSEWTRTDMCCTIPRNPLQPHDPWSSYSSGSCLLVTTLSLLFCATQVTTRCVHPCVCCADNCLKQLCPADILRLGNHVGQTNTTLYFLDTFVQQPARLQVLQLHIQFTW